MSIPIRRRRYYRKLIILGVPILFQNLIGIGLNLIDTLMIGYLGEVELAAAGAANQVYFVYSIALFGLFSGSAVYTSQFYGAKNSIGIKHVVGMDYIAAAVTGFLVTCLSFFFSKEIIMIFSDDPQVIEAGMQYLKIVCFSFVFSALSMSISYNSRAVQQINAPTIINGIAMAINAFLNYVLIFGKMGAPFMGVKGGALATLIARVLELIMLCAYVYTRKEHPFKAGISELFGFSSVLFKRVMKTAIPVIFTEGCWALVTSLVFAAYGKLGTSALAVTQVANVVLNLMMSTYFGVGNATAMLIGEVLGKKKKKEAYLYGKYALWTVFFLNIVATGIAILIAKPVTAIYGFGGETDALMFKTIVTMALLITPKMFAYIFIVGIFRGGGDTFFSMIVEVSCNLFIQLPLAYIAVLVLKTDLPGAMILGEIGDIVRIFLCIPRYKNRKWINIVEQE